MTEGKPADERLEVVIPGEPELTPAVALILLKILKEASERRSAHGGGTGDQAGRKAADLP